MPQASFDALLVDTDDQALLTASQTVIQSAPAAVVTSVEASPEPSPSTEPETRVSDEAAGLAQELGLPLLLDGPELAAELERLEVELVVTVGSVEAEGHETVSADDARNIEWLPLTPPENDAVALVVEGEPASPGIIATLAAAGIAMRDVMAPDPRVNNDSVEAVKNAPSVLGVGAFGDRFASRVEMARSAEQLPGGGVVPFPGHRMVALYGHPNGATLGILGAQSPEASVERVQKLAEEYQPYSDVPVSGCFEIITTVAHSSAGPQGDYSTRTSIDDLLPYIEAAAANDIYCFLDLQPGYSDFLSQAKEYQELLELPHVGLALDPEWRIEPPQRHMQVIGQVQIEEVNAAGQWLADLVKAKGLPAKSVILHQFQPRMIVNREKLDTRRDEIQYLMHADGNGTHGAKMGTWNRLLEGLPDGVRLGWKNFTKEDSPMMTPEQTMAVEPTPDFVSFQ